MKLKIKDFFKNFYAWSIKQQLTLLKPDQQFILLKWLEFKLGFLTENDFNEILTNKVLEDVANE